MRVRIGEYDMEKDFGLKLIDVSLGTPEIKKESIDIPGSNGELDYSETITGYPVFKNAEHTLRFDFKDGNYQAWISISSDIKGKLHGKRLPVILGEDTFYYDARLSVRTDKINQGYSEVEIGLDAYPYRRNSITSIDDYPWDPFCFETDIAQPSTKDIPVPSAVVIYGDAMPTGVIFHCSQAMQVEFKGKTYSLPEGDSSSPDIILFQGENTFTFSGSGTVSLEYRGGRF